MTTHTDVLTRRGLADAAEGAGWTPHTLRRDGKEYDGWKYPVYDAEGNERTKKRWKAANGEGPKYFWPEGQPDGSRYYFLPGLRSAILKAQGVLYLAGGEPDVLAYHAAGIQNVWCWLAAEESVPATLVTDLQYLGVNLAIYAPDRDASGMRSAAKVHELLDGSGIALSVQRLPGDVGSKNDVNDLWISSGFDGPAFTKQLHKLPAVETVDLKLYAQQRGTTGAQAQKNVETDVKRWRNDWIGLVTGALGTPAKQGKHQWWHCPLPSHEDSDPSFRISSDQASDFPWPMCSCDIQSDKQAWETLAAALNVEAWDDYKRTQAQHAGVQLGTAGLERAPVEPDAPLWVSSKISYMRLLSELKCETEPTGTPIAFPFKTMHQFGGFAQWMWTGKTVGMGGITGGGKTMLLKCLCHMMLLAGLDVIWWGPEWSPDEYADQDLLRAGGLDFDQINSLRVAKALARERKCELAQVLKDEPGLAVPGQEAINVSIAKLERMIKQPGHMLYIPDMRMHVADVMKLATKMAHTLRSEGRKPAAFVFDYAQMATFPGKRDWSWGKQVVAEIKAGCASSEANLVGFVGMQSRKGDAENVRKKGERLTMDAAQGADGHPFNLYMTLTPEFDKDGNKYPHGVLSVEKNSAGREGRTRLHVNWSRLMVVDRIAAPPVTETHTTFDPAAGLQTVAKGGDNGEA